jgi:hypothetical protein
MNLCTLIEVGHLFIPWHTSQCACYNALHIACGRKNFPDWGIELLDMMKDGRLMMAVEKLSKVYAK